MYCIETKNLSHSFTRQATVLNNVELQVPTGSIFGFLGPNGAGKTTTIRLLLGLIERQQGEIKIFDKLLEKHRLSILRSIGSLVESPSLYGHLSAVENLSLWQKLYQCPKQRISEVLEIVGLSNTGNKKANRFSLGMKQRLSIAVALLHQPALLILDEPTNGLDPNGIIEIRDLLKKLNKELGISILISSHLLGEIEKLVTHVGIISRGKMVFQGSLNSLVSRQQKSSRLTLETSDLEKSVKVIRSLQLNGSIEDNKIILPVLSKDVIAGLNQKLVETGIDVYEMSPVKKDLESIFMELIDN